MNNMSDESILGSKVETCDTPYLVRALQDVLKTSSRRLGRRKIVTLKTSSRRLEDMS